MVANAVNINSLPASGQLCHLLVTIANCLDPDQEDRMSILIWIQTVRHSDVILERCMQSAVAQLVEC